MHIGGFDIEKKKKIGKIEINEIGRGWKLERLMALGMVDWVGFLEILEFFWGIIGYFDLLSMHFEIIVLEIEKKKLKKEKSYEGIY